MKILHCLSKYKEKREKNQLTKIQNQLIIAINQNIEDSQRSINDFVQILKDFKEKNYSKHDSFFNLCIFSDIAQIDLTLLVEKYRLAQRIQERKLYARVMSIVILDYLDNIGILIGTNCLAELKRNNMHNFMDKFKVVHKNFSTFKKENEKMLREIRNNTIAHKTKDALVLSQQINELNSDSIYEFSIQFNNYIQDFVNLSTKVIYYIADYMGEGKKLD